MYEKWINQLIKIELFKDIEREELKSILGCLKPTIKTYKKKDIITIEKDKLTGIGIVLDGEVVVGKETLAGDRVMMSKLRSGELFGEIAAFASNEWLATVVANTDCTILFFPPQKIVGICNKMCVGHRSLIQNMLQIVSRKALILNKKVDILSLKSIRKKISTYLIEQYNIENNLTFNISLKRNELAEYLLVSRPSLSRELINMQKEGIIDFHRNHFKIIDLQILKSCL
ncbi:Crp/Fnr family transcriptional regulator [Clostridium vincentii]|uniref:Transcriptional activator FtrB n=1 Tax=Clostridium vincentii TaxID=52704 RepID=A0A2T0BKS1_9CLOT|nr:Crp/Fnr family transcriptional regulator [Clostridium vincentii]PRR84498.1 transcriptional activator FtrB [Clostridium vincentii]